MTPLRHELQQRLAVLEPEFLEIIDESAQHVGHAGAKDGGSHLQLTIISTHFNGLGRLARHRLVYQLLGDLIPTHVHALAIKAMTPNDI